MIIILFPSNTWFSHITCHCIFRDSFESNNQVMFIFTGQIMRGKKNRNGKMISLNYFSGGFMVVKVTEDATFAVFF